MAIFVKNTSSDITFYLGTYVSISKFQNQEVDVWVVGHLVTQFQGQILRAATNNRVRGHASVCGHAPPLPLHVFPKSMSQLLCSCEMCYVFGSRTID